MDDEKFDGIREDPRHFGSWCLLLIVADMAWPAPAFPPPTVSKASMKVLIEAELVDSLSGGRFRIRGLDAERGRRRDAARVGNKPGPNATQTGPGRDPDGRQTGPGRLLARGSLDETSLDETKTSRDEHNIAREGLPNLDQGAIRALEHRTGRTWGQAGEKQLTEYDRLIEDHGIEKVLSAMDRIITDGQPMTARQLVWGAMKVLEPMVPVQALLKEDADAERQEERDRNSRRGVEATQRYLRDLRGESA
ncbi:MAG: hypothetical protein Q8Q29_00665 [Actinomycetota bacterium]|nr:hypothetical protein [Actinomycetota bacterium]